MNNEITRKKLAAALCPVFTVVLGISAVALGGDVAAWEAETMTADSSEVTGVSDAKAASGQALRYTDKGRADKLD